MGTEPGRLPLTRHDAIRRQVRGILEKAPAYRALDENRRETLAIDLERMTDLAIQADVAEADFPAFVSELIAGTFESIVDASVEQMNAYADLISQVTTSMHEFVNDAENASARRNRQQLLATMVLMGLSRIDISAGHIRTRPTLRPKKE